ncbi:MAG: aminotransferase class I/II-fold pyridoxal phosphate-dependent enzyme [Acetobacteraceae bacterium]|nr:aminotransferase class I/II-fold pyridoxal phosphate-dependent enzyme [Acetobacteraceae bacterium]
MTSTGLSKDARAALLSRMAGRGGAPAPAVAAQPASARDFATLPAAREIATIRATAAAAGVSNSLFRTHEGIAGGHTRIGNRDYVNYASYNYLGLNGDARVAAAASDAIRRYGVSASASRLVSGERPLHAALEARLAANYGVEDAITFVSGHATNVTVIGHLLGPGDLVVHDQYVHNSGTEGVRLSGAKRVAFPHDDWQAADAAFRAERSRHNRALLLIEGHYSMDGTVPDLARYVEIARRHDAWLMVDEAHALGVVGATGRGSFEASGIAGADVDIWMGTLSKTLCACGGYIAGSHALVDMLRHSAPGFVYSVGLSPPLAAAAETCLRLMQEEPWRVERLQRNATLLRDGARQAGFDVGTSAGVGIVPVILGASMRAGRVSDLLFERGVNAQAIVFPVVPDNAARVRFFLSAEHTEADIAATLDALKDAVAASG